MAQSSSSSTDPVAHHILPGGSSGPLSVYAHLDYHAFARVVLGLGGPLEEGGDVLGQLTLRRRSAVLILNDLTRRRGHGRESGGAGGKLCLEEEANTRPPSNTGHN